jgi:hypothetical protein
LLPIVDTLMNIFFWLSSRICYLQALQELGLDTADLVDEEPSFFLPSSQTTSQEHREYIFHVALSDYKTYNTQE